jgi:hypothetical protein
MTARSRLLVIPLVLLLAGCWNGRAVMIFERPQWDALGGGVTAGARLAAGALVHGYVPRFIVVAAGASPGDALARAAGAMRRGAIVAGPLLSYEWAGYVSRFPDLRFVLVGNIPADAVPKNAVILAFDRRGAFREAGRAAARYAASSAAASLSGARVGLLLSGASDLGPGEAEAFAEGVASEPGTEMESRTLPATADRAAVQSAVGEMARSGAVVILLGLGSMDAWALEVMNGTGSRAVLADWKTSGAFPQQVLVSVEEDLTGSVAAALGALRRGQRSSPGRVAVVRGGAP